MPLQSTASEVASRLVARERARATGSNDAVLMADVLRVASSSLARFIGLDGCHALLTRSLALAKVSHPSLTHITISTEPELSVAGVPESIQAHGITATAAGLQSMFVVLIELLGRLIGDELALKLVEQSND